MSIPSSTPGRRILMGAAVLLLFLLLSLLLLGPLGLIRWFTSVPWD